MRPTSTESLQCMRRVLIEIIVPKLADSYAFEQIGHHIVALEDLARHCHDVIPNLMRANDEMLVLVDAARGLLDEKDALATELDAGAHMARNAPTQYPNFDDLLRRYITLRGLLSRIITAWPRTRDLSPQQSAIREAVRAHLETQVRRFS